MAGTTTDGGRVPGDDRSRRNYFLTGTRHFTASAIVFDEQQRVLLVQDNKVGRWLYPGWYIDPNEDPVQATQREVLEARHAAVPWTDTLVSSIDDT